MRLFFIISALIFTIGSSFAQMNYINKVKQNYIPDSNYIKELPFKFLVNPSFFLKTNDFSINTINPNANKIVYKPNTPMKLNIEGAYKWLRLGFSFNIPSYLNDKGNTESFGLFLNAQTRIQNWGFNFYWVKNKGYYLANPDVNIPNWNDRQEYPFRSDLQTTNIGLYTHVVFSNKLSLKAALQQSEKQIKSAGGFGLQLGFYNNRIENDSGIIPIIQRDFYPEISDMIKGSFTGFDFRPGYAFTYVLNDFYATSMANVGIGFQLQSYKFMSEKNFGFVIAPSFKFQQVIGYNTDDTFVKLAFTYMSSSFNIKHSSFKNNFMTISLGGGIRFL